MSNSDPADDMHYIGLTERTFKERYTSHMSNFRLERYAGSTELSKYVWDLKKKGKNYEIKWEVPRRVPAYSSTSKRCQLCTTEKLCIATANQKTLLNKRSELISTCRQRGNSCWHSFAALRTLATLKKQLSHFPPTCTYHLTPTKKHRHICLICIA